VAIRYSGDVELRITYEAGFYYASIRSPGQRGRAVLSVKEAGLTHKRDKKSPESIDEAALSFLEWAEMNVGELPIEVDEEDRMIVRRRFQAPCPVRT
jgi:hypothetical protein